MMTMHDIDLRIPYQALGNGEVFGVWQFAFTLIHGNGTLI
jgi:hypothetical protein